MALERGVDLVRRIAVETILGGPRVRLQANAEIGVGGLFHTYGHARLEQRQSGGGAEPSDA
jgi:hypothetical protein